MVGPALPDKETWREFKAEHNDFEPGECEHGRHHADKLFWYDKMFVCASCREWLEKFGLPIDIPQEKAYNGTVQAE